MIEHFFEANPAAWFVGILVFLVFVGLSLKYRFYYVVTKIAAAILIIIVLYFALLPYLNNILFDTPFIRDNFWQITLNVWDDWYFEFELVAFIVLSLASVFVLVLAINGQKRGEKPDYMKEKRTD